MNSLLDEARPGSTSRSALERTLGRFRDIPLIPALLVGLLGLTISLVGIGTPSIWYDEAATIISSTRSWPELMQMLTTVDAVHGLYYAVMHLVFDVFGYSPLSLRVPSALAVGAAGTLTVLLGNELFRLRTAVIAGVVFTLLPRTTWMGTEGRSYALTAALTVGLTLVLVRALKSPSRRRWILYGALVVLSCLVFLYLALIVVAHAVAVAVILLVRGRSELSTLRGWLLSTVVATALVIPFALATMGQSKQLHWLDPLGHKTFRQVFVGQWFYTSETFALVGWVVILAGGVALVLRVRRSLRAPTQLAPRRALLAPALLLPLLVVPTAALLLTTVLYLPIYTPRYLTMGLPFVALLMAAGIAAGLAIVREPFLRIVDRIVDRNTQRSGMSRAAATRTALKSPLGSAGVVVLVALVLLPLALPQISAQREVRAKEKTAWNEVAASIADARAADGPDTTTAIVYGGVQFHPIATARVIAYSYPDAFTGTIDVTLDTPAAQTGRLWETTRPLADSLDRVRDADVVYLIASFARDIRPETTRILGDEGWRVDDSWDIGDVHVIRYERG